MAALAVIVGCAAASEKRACAYEGMKASGGPPDLPPVEHLVKADEQDRMIAQATSFRRSTNASSRSPQRRQSLTSALREDREMASDFHRKKQESSSELREQLSKFKFSQRLSVVLEES
jgi:hypothetical protein